jgi:hypothetical protein
MVVCVKVIPNFITKNEALVLNAFVLESVANKQFSNGMASYGLNKDGVHVVSRFNKNLEFPETAFLIKKRIQNLLVLDDKDTNTNWNISGIVVNCSFNEAQVVPHKDARPNNKSLLRCNVLSSAAEKGGVLTVEEKEFKLNVLSMYLCLVSEYTHSVSKIEGNSPRILWQFGFNVDQKDWEDKVSKL